MAALPVPRDMLFTTGDFMEVGVIIIGGTAVIISGVHGFGCRPLPFDILKSIFDILIGDGCGNALPFGQSAGEGQRRCGIRNNQVQFIVSYRCGM